MANLDIGRNIAGILPGGGAFGNSACGSAGKGKSEHTGKGKRQTRRVVETEQLQPSETASTVSYPSQDPSVVGELSCMSSVNPWIMGVTLNSVSSTRRQAGAEYLLPDRVAQLHACPLTYPGQKIPLPDPGIYTASKITTRRRTTGDMQTSRHANFQKDEQSEYFSTRVLCRNQFCLLAVSLSRGTGVIFVQIPEHCSFLTRPRRNVATHGCTRKRVCSLSKGRWLRP